MKRRILEELRGQIMGKITRELVIINPSKRSTLCQAFHDNVDPSPAYIVSREDIPSSLLYIQLPLFSATVYKLLNKRMISQVIPTMSLLNLSNHL